MWKLLVTFAVGVVTGALLEQTVESENDHWKLYTPESDNRN